MSEEYDYRIDDPSAERIDEIAPTKFLVAKSDMTEDDAKSIFDREKIEVFKGFFKRPKENEVQIKSIKKSYEPYLIIGGQYEIRYLAERTYDIDLIDDTVSVFILGEEIIVPKKEDDETEVEIKGKKKRSFFDGLFSGGGKKEAKPEPEIQIKGIEHIHIQKDIMETINYKGSSINPDSLPDVDFLDVNDQFLEVNVKMVPKEYIDIEKFTTDIIDEYATRPDIAKRVIFEKLIITDKKMVFYPIYWASMIYKDSKEKNVRLDGITKKVEVQKGTRFAPPPDSKTEVLIESPAHNLCPECGHEIEEDDFFCENCGVRLLPKS